MKIIQYKSSLNDRFPWARAELTRAFSSSGFRRLRFPTGVDHLIQLFPVEKIYSITGSTNINVNK